MPIIKLRPTSLPENIQVISIDAVLIYEGIDVQPGDKILRINTNLGKRYVESLIQGRVCDPLPIVGDKLSKSIPHFITLDVEEEPVIDHELFNYLDIDEPEPEVEKEIPTEKTKPSKKEGAILAPIIIGGLFGLFLTYSEEDFFNSTPILIGLFLLLVATIGYGLVRDSWKSGFYGACFFVLGCLIFPKIPIVKEMAFNLGDTAYEYIYDYKRDREREEQHQLDVAYQQAIKKIEQAKQKANREIKTENSTWNQDKWHDDYGEMDMEVINGSDRAVKSLEVDLYDVGVWRVVTFSPPLEANNSRTMTLIIPTNIDGYPIETKHKKKSEQQTYWYNNHRNIEFVTQK